MYLNRITFSGNAVKEPEIVDTPGGKRVAKFSLAQQTGKGSNCTTIYMDCEAWNGLADIVYSYLKKGRKCVVDGMLKCRTYAASDGSKRKVWWISCNDVLFMEGQAAQPVTETDDNQPYDPFEE